MRDHHGGGVTSRQRMLDALEYRRPDRIPVVYHQSPAGLHVHGRKLLDLLNEYPPDNPAVFDAIPAPAADCLDSDGRYHEFRKDEWGVTWEYRIFGIAGHPKEHPFADWAAAREYALPELPEIGSPEFEKARAKAAELKRNYLAEVGGVSLLERLCALRPMDEVLMDLASRDEDLLAFLDRLNERNLALVEYAAATGADAVFMGDDWGTQLGPIISPALFREVFRPRIAELTALARARGMKVFYHSCGKLGPILDDLIELGVDLLWHQVALYDADELAEKCRRAGVALYIHPDRQRLIPLGTPEEIREYVCGHAERIRRMGGGGIFYVEIENDAPFENVEALVESIDEFR